MKRLLLSFFILLCAGFALAESIPNGGTITCAYYDEPTTLNPLETTEGSSMLFNNLIFNGLTRVDEHMNLVPELAEKWEVSPDGLTWTYYLRTGVRFHDGTELTADDVVYTFTRYLNPSNPRPVQTISQTIKSIRAEGSSVLKVLLNFPNALLPNLMMGLVVSSKLMKSSATSDAELGKHPIGTGPFKLVELKPGRIALDANKDYFEGRPHLDRLIFKLFPDQKKAWVSLMQGETDVVINLDQDDYDIIKNDSRFKVFEMSDQFCYNLLFNLKDPLFSQKELRQAISMVIDRKDLVDKVLSGSGITTTGPFTPNTWPYNDDPSLQAFDPAKASKLLSRLGWQDTDGDWVLEKGNQELRFTVIVDQGDKLKENTAKRLQWQFLQAGIRMDIEIVPFQDLMQKKLIPGSFQATLFQFNTAVDPDRSLSVFWQSTSIGHTNLGSYSNKEVDKLIDEGKRASDPTKRKEIYQKIHAIISSDTPAAFLFYKKRYSAVSDRLAGIGNSIELFYNVTMKDWYVKR